MKPKCSIENCSKEARGTHGFCKAHYLRWWRHGDPLAGGTSPGAEMMFIRDVCFNPPEKCVEWPYAKDPQGYGVLRIGDRNKPAHRYALEVHSKNPVPYGIDCCHLCNNPACVNPLHLYAGTRKQNMNDCIEAGRIAKGERHGNHKLTTQDVLNIRADQATQIDIAKRYGISNGHVSELKNGKKWGWLAVVAIFLALCFDINAFQSVTLCWDPNKEADVSSYTIYYGLSSRNYPNSTNVGNVTTATVYGLAEGSSWFFAITALNTSGLESGFSNEITNAIPSNVTNFCPTISAIGDVVLLDGDETNLIFQIWDIETNPKNLLVTASSTNILLLPLVNIELSGTNHLRTLRLLLEPDQCCTSLVTVAVSDGSKASSTSFLVTVKCPPVQVRRLLFTSNLQFAPTPTGPWTNILTTILPVEIGTNGFYRTWVDLWN